MDIQSAKKMCSFCGRRGDRDSQLCSGLGAMICADCLATYHREGSTRAGAPGRRDRSGRR